MKIVEGSKYLADVKKLIIEYTDSLNRNLEFQGLRQELENLDSKYKQGDIFIALSHQNEPIGCAALYEHNKNRCEMKRLYVKPKYRKLKLGKKLVERIIQSAKDKGYKEMVLDTIKPLKSAIHLYKKFGFVECEPYYNNPMDDVIYLKLKL